MCRCYELEKSENDNPPILIGNSYPPDHIDLHINGEKVRSIMIRTKHKNIKINIESTEEDT